MKGHSHGTATSAATAATDSPIAAVPTNLAAASPDAPPRVIAIIGGGFSGTSLAIQLLRGAGAARVHVLLFEPRETPGAGVAYAARDYPYPLNVAAGRMSLDGSNPGDFLAFARAQGIHAAAGDYLPRQVYGEYVQARFAQARRDAPPGVKATHLRARVIQLRRAEDGRFELWLDDGRAHRADEVVLACGHSAPGELEVFQPILGTRHYVGEPWSIGSWGNENVESVLLVGSGLTMVDAALRLAAIRPRVRRIQVLSRHGLLPLPQPGEHRREVKASLAEVQAGQNSVRTLTRALRREAARIVEAGGDWGEALAALRPQLPAIWSAWPPAERSRFLRHLRAWWDVHRHRVPGGALAAVRSLERIGVLEVHAGRLESLRLLDDSVEVQWRPRGKPRARAWLVDRVVNCTGPDSRIASNPDPLIQSLLRNGWLRADAHALGVDVDADGRVISRNGEAVHGLYYLGPWLRARDWEATAVPELREHAARLAERLLAPSESRLSAPP